MKSDREGKTNAFVFRNPYFDLPSISITTELIQTGYFCDSLTYTPQVAQGQCGAVTPMTGVTARWCVYTHEPIIGYRQQIGVLKGIRKPGRAAFCVSHKVSVTQTLYKLPSSTQPMRHTSDQ